jgi:hypothetical protein
VLAFVFFCLLASGVYAWNDIVDSAQDRAHPAKRHRPVASGLVSPRAAAVVGLLLVAVALAGGWSVAPAYAAILVGYLLLNVLYTFQLKSVVILDVFAISAFFILRLLAGCAAIGVLPSVWLLLCGGLLALYLGFAKRRHELLLLQTDSRHHRAVLQHYDAALLDQTTILWRHGNNIMHALADRGGGRVGGAELQHGIRVVRRFPLPLAVASVAERRRRGPGGNPAHGPAPAGGGGHLAGILRLGHLSTVLSHSWEPRRRHR